MGKYGHSKLLIKSLCERLSVVCSQLHLCMTCSSAVCELVQMQLWTSFNFVHSMCFAGCLVVEYDPRHPLCAASQALRHLMREGSPIADLYAVCNTCTCLQSELRELLLEAHEVRCLLVLFCNAVCLVVVRGLPSALWLRLPVFECVTCSAVAAGTCNKASSHYHDSAGDCNAPERTWLAVHSILSRSR